MSLRVTILGCGSSAGVPRVGAGWGACDPAEPRNRRRRCSILLEQDGVRVLVDTSPDLREQLLDAGVDRLDAVAFTHEHADHTHGIDDLRSLVLFQRRRIDAWMDERTAGYLDRKFGYIFETPPGSDYPPILNARRYRAGEPATIPGCDGASMTVTPFEVEHGRIPALGLRVGAFAYLPDVSRVPDEAWPVLGGLDLLVLDALRWTPHPSHLTVDEALAVIARVRPRHAVLTNLHVDLDYGALASGLPRGVEPAHDGMVLEVAS